MQHQPLRKGDTMGKRLQHPCWRFGLHGGPTSDIRSSKCRSHHISGRQALGSRAPPTPVHVSNSRGFIKEAACTSGPPPPPGNSANLSQQSEGAAAADGCRQPFVAASEYEILKLTRFYTHLCAGFIYSLIQPSIGDVVWKVQVRYCYYFKCEIKKKKKKRVLFYLIQTVVAPISNTRQTPEWCCWSRQQFGSGLAYLQQSYTNTHTHTLFLCLSTLRLDCYTLWLYSRSLQTRLSVLS